jgi:gluconokinase
VAAPELVFVHLSGDREVIARRMAARTDHFMPLTLLDSQLATLQPLADDEPGEVVDIDAEPDVVAERAAEAVRRLAGDA